MQKPERVFSIGIAGTAITAICCFTPVLVIGLGAIGLSAWLAWLDYVLLPMFIAFSAVALLGGWLVVRARRAAARREDSP
ncbi:MAG: mercury resistance system transport protein MerF [Gammaproteobacteria bacterium]|nr:mercury resistance system transport protein MerF [Gammaproteobacteria bacterium]